MNDRPMARPLRRILLMIQSLSMMFQVLTDTFHRFVDLEVPRMAAALAFYLALSFAPLALLFVSVSATVAPHLKAGLADEIGALAGPGAKSMFEEVMIHAQENPDLSSLSGLLGVLSLIFSASVIFGELRTDLNKIFAIRTPPRDSSVLGGIVTFLRERIAHIGLVLSFIFLLMISLVISSLLSFFTGGDSTGWWLLNLAVSMAFYVAAFALMLRYVPARPPPWSWCWKGGALIALLFAVGKELIGLYIGRSALSSAYGATGAAIIFLAWIYYSGTVVFLGATLTATLTRQEESAP